MEKPRHLARRVTRVGVVDTTGRAGIHRDDRRAGASLGRSAPLGVVMADDSEVQPLLTRAAKDAAGRADESSSGRVSRAKGACASHREPRTRRSRAIGSVRCLSTRGALARDAHAILSAFLPPRSRREPPHPMPPDASVYRKNRSNPRSRVIIPRFFRFSFFFPVLAGAARAPKPRVATADRPTPPPSTQVCSPARSRSSPWARSRPPRAPAAPRASARPSAALENRRGPGAAR